MVDAILTPTREPSLLSSQIQQGPGHPQLARLPLLVKTTFSVPGAHPSRKHALFITYHTPREGSSSWVLRALNYTRYLGRFGRRVTVVTRDRDAYEQTKLEEQVPEDVHVVRMRFIETKRHFGDLGTHRVLRNDPVNMIYSTSHMRPPTSSH